jgi:hypothetical protein
MRKAIAVSIIIACGLVGMGYVASMPEREKLRIEKARAAHERAVDQWQACHKKLVETALRALSQEGVYSGMGQRERDCRGPLLSEKDAHFKDCYSKAIKSGFKVDHKECERLIVEKYSKRIETECADPKAEDQRVRAQIIENRDRAIVEECGHHPGKFYADQ